LQDAVSEREATPTDCPAPSPFVACSELFVPRTKMFILKQNLMVPADLRTHIGVTRIGVRYAAMRNSGRWGI